MHSLNGKVIDVDWEQVPEEDDLFERLEREGYLGGSRRGRMESVSDELKRALNGRKSGSGSFLQIRQGLYELVSVQEEIDWNMRSESSPVLYTANRVASRVSQLMGVGKGPRSLDDLFDHEVSVVKSLDLSLGGAIDYSRLVLDAVVEYRDSSVLAKFTEAMDGRGATEAKASQVVGFFKAVEERLASTPVTSPDYSRLYRAHGAIKRQLMELDNQISKYNNTIVFRKSELDVLTTHIELVNHGVLLLDRLGSYVSNVAEHIEGTKDVYRFFREGCMEMGEVYEAFGRLSNCVIRGAKEMGEQMGHMTHMAWAAYGSDSMPDTLQRLLSRYKTAMFSADMRQRSAVDTTAETILRGFGL